MVRRLGCVIGCIGFLVLLGACADEGTEFRTELSGANEVCDDPDACGGGGSGTATLTVNNADANVCYTFELEGIEGVSAAHIHAGAEGQSGDPVVDLAYQGDDEGAEGCIEGADPQVLEDILESPSDYYVNVHTERYPDGAGRGQLGSE